MDDTSESFTDESGRPFYALVHPGAPEGVVFKRPEPQEQDRQAEPSEHFAVIFFPRYTGLCHASVNFYSVRETLSASPEAAISRFMDKICQREKWQTYHEAGHRVRRVMISDMGDAEDQFVDRPVTSAPVKPLWPDE